MTSAILSGTVETNQQFTLSEIVVEAQAEVPGGPFLDTNAAQTVSIEEVELHHPNPFELDPNTNSVAISDTAVYQGGVIDLHSADVAIERCYFSQTGVRGVGSIARTLP